MRETESLLVSASTNFACHRCFQKRHFRFLILQLVSLIIVTLYFYFKNMYVLVKHSLFTKGFSYSVILSLIPQPQKVGIITILLGVGLASLLLSIGAD